METKRYDPEDLIGRQVHYVATDAARVDGDGVKRPDVRAMIITSVLEYDGRQVVNGIVFRSGPGDSLFPVTAFEVMHRFQNEENHFEPSSWHMPPRELVCTMEGCKIATPHVHSAVGPKEPE